MKKYLVPTCVILLFSALVTLPSCKKEDTVAPSLLLKGGTQVYQRLPSVAGKGVWVDPGFTSVDNKDGDITNQVHVFGAVNPNLKGLYSLIYSSKDAAGNITALTRKVYITNDADSLAAVYSVRDSTPGTIPAVNNYNVTISSDKNVNNRILFYRFSGSYNDTVAYGLLDTTRTLVTIPNQRISGIGFGILNTETHAYTGGGNDSISSSKPLVLNLIYSDTTVVGANPGVVITHYTHWSH
jgi:hypothetical protein